MRHLSSLLLVLLLASPAWGLSTTLTNGDLPYTASTANESLYISGTSVSYSGHKTITISAANVKIFGNGDTLFYGTGGGNGVDGQGAIFLSGIAAGGFYMRDLKVIHDPGNNGAYADPHSDPDTASTVASNHGCYMLSPNGVTFINCTFIVYGYNARNIDCQGIGTATKNVLIDSCHFWNECNTYFSRHSYDGAAVRLETRPTFSGGDFAAHIYRSVVHRAPQMAFTVYGAVTSNLAKGIEILYCSTYVDARNPGGQNANQYGISTRMTTSPFRIAHNYIGAGTQYGGSRGIMLESCDATAEDPMHCDSNVINIWSGPDAENGNGECRGIRVREIDNGTWNNYYIVGNRVEITLDTSSATTHIGVAGWCLNMTFGFGEGNGLVEGNTLILRSLVDDASITGTAMHAGNEMPEWGDKTTPMVFRYNKLYSSAWINWGADKANGGSAYKHTYFSDSLSFLPSSDSGVNITGRVVWRMSQATAPDSVGRDNKAVNIWYDTTNAARAYDTNIVHSPSQIGELTLIQRIPITVFGELASPDSLVDTFRVVCSTFVTPGSTNIEVYDTTIASGTTLDFRYWKTYGTGAGSDSTWTDWTFDIIKGGESVKITDTTIDWTVTCLNFRLANVRGTLDPADSCAALTSYVGCVLATLPTSFAWTDTIGTADPDTSYFRAFHTGDSGTIYWTATKGQSWLTLEEASGSLTNGQIDTSGVSVAKGALGANIYYDTIVVMDTSGCATDTSRIPVTFTIVDTVSAPAASIGAGTNFQGVYR